LKGEVRIEQTLEDDAVFERGRRVTLAASGGGRETQIEFFRRQHGRCVMKFRGIDSISEAEKYIGTEIKIPENELPALRDGYFYTFRLKGCSVFTSSGECIGIVTDVIGSGGTEILKVDRDNEEILIPFAHQYMKKIDPDERKIEVDLPEDLRDLNK
jgi:16S rRNA processing protein RimM